MVSGVLDDLIIFLLAEPSTQCAVLPPKNCWVKIHFPEVTFFLVREAPLSPIFLTKNGWCLLYLHTASLLEL